jgi:hypothetical protein
LNAEHRRGSIISNGEFHHDEVVSSRDPSDVVSHRRRVLSTPLGEVVYAFESLSRLRKLEYRAVVIDLMSAIYIRPCVFEVPPHLLE